MSSYRERALARVNENNEINEISAETSELIKELENSNKQIQSLQGNIAILNSQLSMQKQINIGLGIAYFVLILSILIKIFLTKYAKVIRNKTIEELNSKD